MRKIFFSFFYLTTIGVLILSACNLPVSSANAESTPQINASTSTVAATVEWTVTPTSQATGTFTLTPSETPLLEPSETATPQAPKAAVVRETNCRVGPAGNYDLV